jgi:putative acetyltransferase
MRRNNHRPQRIFDLSGLPSLRPYAPADEPAAIELWRRTWQLAYPAIDFTARLDWWRTRWRDELVTTATITVAERDGAMVGFVTVDPGNGYLDQIVVAPEEWGGGVAAALLAAAREVAPAGLDLHVNADNERAVRFYGKHGFSVMGRDVNPRSGAPVLKLGWRP